MTKKQAPTPKKYLCINCGRIFIDTTPKEFLCQKCKGELNHEIFILCKI